MQGDDSVDFYPKGHQHDDGFFGVYMGDDNSLSFTEYAEWNKEKEDFDSWESRNRDVFLAWAKDQGELIASISEDL